MLKIVLTAGFAMFSMFFGSGNLVFPLLLGTQTLHQSWMALPGFLITAVLVPFLGLTAMIAFDGNRERFFSTLGMAMGFILTFLMLALIGPFGVIPRCITVAFGGLKLVWPHLPFPFFSAIFCALVGALIWKPNKVVDIIGLVLTPFKLGGIVLIILFGMYFAEPAEPSTMVTIDAFKLGFGTGYQTLDLLAAFFFSSTIVDYLRRHMGKTSHVAQKTLIRSSLSASLIGALLLAIIYTGFVALGAAYAPHLQNASPEALLAAIAGLTMGKYALMIVSITLAASCLATAVILANLFVAFLREDIAEKRLHFRLSNTLSIIFTMVGTYTVAQFGFAKICSVIGAILELTYPAFIALSIHHILTLWFNINHSKPIFWTVLMISVAVTYLG